jgi:hypothetical protein
VYSTFYKGFTEYEIGACELLNISIMHANGASDSNIYETVTFIFICVKKYLRRSEYVFYEVVN